MRTYLLIISYNYLIREKMINVYIRRCSLKSPETSPIPVLIILKKHKVDEHERAEERSLDLDVEVDREADAEVVGVGEVLASQPRPMLRHGADLVFPTQVQHLEFDVTEAGATLAGRADDLDERRFLVLAINRPFRGAA